MPTRRHAISYSVFMILVRNGRGRVLVSRRWTGVARSLVLVGVIGILIVIPSAAFNASLDAFA